MPWYFPWSDSIKKRAVRYLLQHYMGHFLKEKLGLDQLTVDLYSGTGTAKDILLDVAVSGVNYFFNCLICKIASVSSALNVMMHAHITHVHA